MRGLAEVVLEAVEEGRDVRSRGEREVLAADLAEPGGVTEVGHLASGGSGDGELDGDGSLVMRM